MLGDIGRGNPLGGVGMFEVIGPGTAGVDIGGLTTSRRLTLG
jgi:hypothetical protein